MQPLHSFQKGCVQPQSPIRGAAHRPVSRATCSSLRLHKAPAVSEELYGAPTVLLIGACITLSVPLELLCVAPKVPFREAVQSTCIPLRGTVCRPHSPHQRSCTQPPLEELHACPTIYLEELCTPL